MKLRDLNTSILIMHNWNYFFIFTTNRCTYTCNIHLVSAVMLTSPFRGFAEVLISVNFFQTELLLLQPVMYHKDKKRQKTNKHGFNRSGYWTENSINERHAGLVCDPIAFCLLSKTRRVALFCVMHLHYHQFVLLELVLVSCTQSPHWELWFTKILS